MARLAVAHRHPGRLRNALSSALRGLPSYARRSTDCSPSLRPWGSKPSRWLTCSLASGPQKTAPEPPTSLAARPNPRVKDQPHRCCVAEATVDQHPVDCEGREGNQALNLGLAKLSPLDSAGGPRGGQRATGAVRLRDPIGRQAIGQPPPHRGVWRSDLGLQWSPQSAADCAP